MSPQTALTTLLQQFAPAPAAPTDRLNLILAADQGLQSVYGARQTARMAWVADQYRRDAERDARAARSKSAIRAIESLTETRIANLPTAARMDSLYVSPNGLGGPFDAQATTQINAQNPLLTPWTLQTLYQQDGLCTRICDLPPNAAIMQSGWFVQDPTSDPDPMLEEDERLEVRFNAYCADLFARIYGGGYLLIIADEIVPPKTMREPLRLDNIRRITNLIPMTTLECTAVEPTTRPGDPNFGEPDAWACTPYPYLEGTPGTIYHHTRVLRFSATTLPNRDRARNRGADQSPLQAAMEALISMGILNQSVGNIAQRMHALVYEMKDLVAMLAGNQGAVSNDATQVTTDGQANLQARLALLASMRSVYNMTTIQAGEKLDVVSAPPTGWDQLSAHAMTAVSSQVGIPRPILFEPEGGFSQGDAQRDELQAFVKQHQTRVIDPPFRKLYKFLYAQQDGPTARRLRSTSVGLYQSLHRSRWSRSAIAALIHYPTPLTAAAVKQADVIANAPAESPIPPSILIPSPFSISFRPLHTEDSKEQAERRETVVGYLLALAEKGVLDAQEIRTTLFGLRGWQDEVQPLPPLPGADNLPAASDLTVQAILIDVIKGGDMDDARETLTEQFPTLIPVIDPLLEAAAKFRKAPDQVSAPDVEVPKVELTPTDLAAIISVNEGRASKGLPPYPTEDGKLTIAEFTAKHGATIAAAANAAAGETTPPPAPTVTETPQDAAPIPLRREVAAGGTRSGTGPDGEPWSVQMPCDYGEIPGTKGLDGEPVDYLLIPEGPRGMAYVAEILLPGEEGDEPTLDEHKVILGCSDEDSATSLLSDVYGESVEIGKIIALPEPRLLAWLETSAHPSASALDTRPPEAVRAAVRQGLAWHKEGIRSNATPATVAWARRLAAGMPLSKARLRSVAAAHRLHAAPEPLTDGAPPTPAHVRHALTGGDAGREWIASLLANRTDAVPEKYGHIHFKPPEGVQNEAQKGLDWRREHGRGGTPVGIARARDLARGAEMSPETIRRMHSFFARHEVDKKGKGWSPGEGFPSNGRIAWALWGGDPGRAWAEKVYRQMEAADRT